MDDIVFIQQREIDVLRERVRQLEDMLVPPTVHVPIEFRLTASEARVFAHLATRDQATKDSIMMAMYSDRPGEQPEIKIVDVFVCNMRRKLRRFQVEIITVWGSGYALVDRSRFTGGRAE